MADRPTPAGATLRTRVTLAATLAVTAVLVAGGVLLLIALRTSLVDNVADAAAVRAADLANLAAADSLPAPIPIPIQDDDEALVQVVDDNDTVVASSDDTDDLDEEDPLPLDRVAPGRVRLFDTTSLPDQDGETSRVVGQGVDTPSGPVTIYVAITLEAVDDVVDEATRLAALGLPVLVAALAAVVWWLVGRTLAPVEAIRAGTDEIGGHDLHRRVPVSDIDDEIGRLGRTINRMLDRLEDSADRQRRFVGDAAHELRSPIASLRTQLETARDSPRVIDWREVSDDLLDETLRMQHLTEQLLMLARIDATGSRLYRTTVDLDELVADRISAIHPDPDNLTVRARLSPARMAGDPVLLGQVVANLLDNAVRHADTTVTVIVASQHGEAVLSVADDGHGIPADRRDDVFQRFVRLDDARTRDDGGAGLGLAIVADIIAAHDGAVTIVDQSGDGTTIEVRLPMLGPDPEVVSLYCV